MEAIFSYISFEDEELFDGNEAHESNLSVAKSIKQLARNVSFVALKPFKRFKKVKVSIEKEERKSVVKSVVSTAKIATTILSNINRGIFQAIRGSPRPTWDYLSHFAFDFLRSTMQGSGVTNLQQLRYGEEFGSRWIDHTPDGVKISLIKFEYDSEKLLEYERNAKYNTPGSSIQKRYPIPDEYPHMPSSITVDGEWIVPNEPIFYSKRSKKRTFRQNLRRRQSESHSPRKVILFLHGGAYIFGNAKLYRSMTGILAKNTGHPVLAINYRRGLLTSLTVAPEYPFPAGLHDSLAAYLWLLQPDNPLFLSEDSHHEPYQASDIIVSGDSAGGGLTMSLLNLLNMYLMNDDGSLMVPLPRGAVLLSPWVDLTCSSKSWEENKGLDFLPASATNLHQNVFSDFQHPVYSYCFGSKTGRHLKILTPDGSKLHHRIPSIPSGLTNLSNLSETAKKDQEWAKNTLDEEERDELERFVRHPLVSPVFGNFKGMCPILIQIGECELLRDESIALAFKYKSQNKDSTKSWIRHELYCDMVHDFQVGSVWLPAARLSIKLLSQFVGDLFANGDGDLNSRDTPELTFEESKLIRMIDSHHDIS